MLQLVSRRPLGAPRRAPPTAGSSRRCASLWGEDDVALGAGMARASLALCREVDLTFLAGAGHWVQHEAAEQVNGLLLDFLA